MNGKIRKNGEIRKNGKVRMKEKRMAHHRELAGIIRFWNTIRSRYNEEQFRIAKNTSILSIISILFVLFTGKFAVFLNLNMKLL